MPEEVDMTSDEFVDLVEQAMGDVLDLDETGELPGDLDKKIAEHVERSFEEWAPEAPPYPSEGGEGRSRQERTLKEAVVAATAGEEGGFDPLAYKDVRKQVTGSDAPGALFAAAAAEYSEHLNERNHSEIDIREIAGKDGAIGEIHKSFMNATEIDAGAGVVPTPIAQDWIEFLREATIVRQSGAMQAEMPAGGLKVPQITQGSTAYHVGEGEAPDDSELKIQMKELDAKKIAAAVPLSNDLIRRAPRMTTTMVEDDLSSEVATQEDKDFLFGAGTDSEAEGIWSQMQSSNQFTPSTNGSGDYDLDTVLFDLLRAKYLPTKSNATLRTPCWYMSPRTVHWLMRLRGQDSLLFMPQLSDGNLFGDPVYTTNSFPTTGDYSGGGDNDETRVIYGDASRILIGTSLNLEVVDFEEAMKLNGSVEAIKQRDIRGVGIFHESDILLRRNDVHAGIDECDWGTDLD